MVDDFAARVRDILSGGAVEIAADWLHEIRQHVAAAPRRVYPEDTLLNHVPGVLRRLADAAAGEALEVAFVRREVSKLARLRRRQGYDAAEVAEEFDLLADLVLSYLEERGQAALESAHPREVLAVVARLRRGLDLLSQMALATFREDDDLEREQRSAMLAEFGRAVAHEIRNRVHGAKLAIAAYRELTDDGQRPTEHGAAMLERIEGSLANVTSAVNDVYTLAVTRHEGGAPEEEGAPPLRTVIADVVRDLSSEADEAGVRIEVADDLPPISVDPVYARLVLHNLVSNAIKYRDEVEGETSYVRVGVESDERMWRVVVADNGVGITPEDHASIFERYVRGAEARTRQGQGIGLDLASRAAGRLGGVLGLDSVRGEGSRFWFTLPKRDDDGP